MSRYFTKGLKSLWSRLSAHRPKPRKRYNVGVSVTDMVLTDGTIVPIKLVGRVDNFFGEATVTPAKYRMDRLFDDEWILGGDGVSYNRAYVHHYYQPDHQDYWIEL